MTWKMYIFVRIKDKNGKRFSKGKLAGQVGHVCMRMGMEMGTLDVDPDWSSIDPIWYDYIADGEIKLVFKTNWLSDMMVLYHQDYYKHDVKFYEYGRDELFNKYKLEFPYYSSTVKDITTGEHIALAVLTQETIDTSEMKLL